jgi:hypothetical protein
MARTGGGPKTRRGGPGQETAPYASPLSTLDNTSTVALEQQTENARARFLARRHFLRLSAARVYAAELATVGVGR